MECKTIRRFARLVLKNNAICRFLLAHLQVRLICDQSSLKRVRESLETLPTKLYDFYEKALQRIAEQPEDGRQQARKALTYIHCAQRPLSLEELRHAMSVDLGDTQFDEAALPETDVLFNISAGLIRLDEKSNTMSLVHHTLQEYLGKNPAMLLSRPHAEMARICLTYLSFDCFEEGPCNNGRALKQRLQEHQFLDYASHNWGDHLVHHQLPDDMDLLFSFIQTEEKVASFLQVLHAPRHQTHRWYDHFPRRHGPLHIMARWGLDKAIAIFYEESMSLNDRDSHGTTSLQLAARYGHLSTARFLIDRGVDMDVGNLKKETAIYWAARNGHAPIVQLLVERGADVSIEDFEGWTPLDWATIGENVEIANLLLELHPESDDKNKALILAAEAGAHTIVQALLDTGAEVDWKDDAGSTALTWAVPAGHEEVTRVLLRNGSDVNSKDIYDNTPLHWALPYEELVGLLLASGADTNAKNNRGQTPLLWTAQDGQESTLRTLLQHNPNVNVEDCYGFTPLHAAALKGSSPVVQMLLDNGADPNKKDVDGWTPLHAAAVKHHDEVIRLLLHKVDDGVQKLDQIKTIQKDAKNCMLLSEMAERKSEGSTVVSGLRSAAQDDKLERMQALLENGADIDADDACGGTALTLAAYMNRERVVRFLLDQGADVNKCERSGRSALHFASEDGHYRLIRMLVERGADVNADVHGWTPILLAARRGYLWVVEYLVEEGADPNADDFHGRRALHWTARHDQWTTTEVLLQAGAMIDAVDRWGRTALAWAASSKALFAGKCLLQNGADVEAKMQGGFTPLHLASYVGDEDMASLLLKQGASINARTDRGYTALHIAVLLQRKKLTQMLMKHDDNVDVKVQWAGRNAGSLDEVEDSVAYHFKYAGSDDEKVLRAADHLERCMLRLLTQEGVGSAAKSWTASQLAHLTGNTALQRVQA